MRSLRLRAGSPSLAELARAMSCSHSTVSAYLNGHRLPPIGQLVRFALACRGDAATWRRKLADTHERLNRLPEPDSPRSSAAEDQFNAHEHDHGPRQLSALGPSSIPAAARQPTARQARPPEIWEGVPERNSGFTGRLELLRHARESIVAASGAGTSLVLYGLPGAGKTAVAIEYTYRYSTEYDVVSWIPSSHPALARSGMARLALPLGLPTAQASGIDSATEAAVGALGRGDPYARWLLVFDEADQPEDIAGLIPDGCGHVLITSRNPQWRETVDAVEVGLFTRTESAAFLNRRLVYRRLDQAIGSGDADLLAEKLGDLPLGLEHAASLLSETGMPPAEYVRLLSQQPGQILDMGTSPHYPMSMSKATKSIIARLEAAEPNASVVLRCFAFFDPEPVPLEGILRREYSADRLSPGTAAPLNDMLADPFWLGRVLDQIRRFGLARIDSTRKTIQIHRLVQALLRDELTTAEEAALRSGAHFLFTRAIPDNPGDKSTWPQLAKLAAHMGPARVLESSDPDVRAHILRMIRLLSLSGSYTTSRVVAETALKQWTADSGQDDPHVLAAHGHLGDVLRELGEYRAAADITKPALQRARQVFGTEHETSAFLAIGSNSDQRARGDFGEALRRDKASVALCREIFGISHPASLRATNNLALDLELTSDYAAARDLYLSALNQIQDMRETSKVDVVIFRTGLSRATRLVGAYREARTLAEQTREFSHQELGPEHPWTLRAARELSIAWRCASAYTQALDLARSLLDQCKRLFGEHHPDTLAAGLCMANALRSTGHIDQSIAMAEDVAVRGPSVYGANHPHNNGINGNLALLRRVSGDITGAYDLNRACRANLERELGNKHHHTLIVTANLASDLSALGELRTARQLGETALQRSQELLGEVHPMTLRCAYNLSLDRSADNLVTRTAANTESLISYLAEAIGPQHPDIENMKRGNRINFDFDLSPT